MSFPRAINLFGTNDAMPHQIPRPSSKTNQSITSPTNHPTRNARYKHHPSSSICILTIHNIFIHHLLNNWLSNCSVNPLLEEEEEEEEEDALPPKGPERVLGGVGMLGLLPAALAMAGVLVTNDSWLKAPLSTWAMSWAVKYWA